MPVLDIQLIDAFCYRHILLEMCLKNAVEYVTAFRAEIQSGDINVGAVSIGMILKAMRSNEVT